MPTARRRPFSRASSLSLRRAAPLRPNVSRETSGPREGSRSKTSPPISRSVCRHRFDRPPPDSHGMDVRSSLGIDVRSHGVRWRRTLSRWSVRPCSTCPVELIALSASSLLIRNVSRETSAARPCDGATLPRDGDIAARRRRDFRRNIDDNRHSRAVGSDTHPGPSRDRELSVVTPMEAGNVVTIGARCDDQRDAVAS